MTKFKIGDVICNIYPTTPLTGTVVAVTASGYIVKDFKTGVFSFVFGAEHEYKLCAPPAGQGAFIPPTPKFAVGQCVERNGSPKLAGQIWKIDSVYHFHRFGGADFHYGIADTERLFHEVQCIDTDHEWSTPRPLPGAPTTPTPECTEGHTKPGYVCSGGKWVPYTPEEIHEMIEQPLPNTIEFQELIPGIKPPRVPILIPGMEKIPLLPGWIIRDPAGRVINAGLRIPVLTWEIVQPEEEPQEEHPVVPILPDIHILQDMSVLSVDALEEEEMEL